MNVEQAAGLIRQGEVVAFPTETVYGLGADAWNPEAILKIYQLKGRPADNPLIIHLPDSGMVQDFAPVLTEPVMNLAGHLWPGPLTLVLKKRPEVLDAVTSGLPTVALRIPKHPVALELLKAAGPLAAPSANRSGRPSPTSAEHVRSDFGDDFPVLEGGRSEIGLESTVLDVTGIPFRILRPGKYTAETLSRIAGVPVTYASPDTDGEKPASPGVKYSHYQPDALVFWLDSENPPDPEVNLLLTHTASPPGYPNHIHFNGDFGRFARQLYDLFRRADRLDLRGIAVEKLPEGNVHEMIPALLNRITKAAGKRT